jgi:hypothetical protein
MFADISTWPGFVCVGRLYRRGSIQLHVHTDHYLVTWENPDYGGDARKKGLTRDCYDNWDSFRLTNLSSHQILLASIGWRPQDLKNQVKPPAIYPWDDTTQTQDPWPRFDNNPFHIIASNRQPGPDRNALIMDLKDCYGYISTGRIVSGNDKVSNILLVTFEDYSTAAAAYEKYHSGPRRANSYTLNYINTTTAGTILRELQRSRKDFLPDKRWPIRLLVPHIERKSVWVDYSDLVLV